MSESSLHSDEAARVRIRSELDKSFVVEASAGTGKTTELCHRIVAVLSSGVDVSRIAAVTFTDKAAGELKLRLRSQLEVTRRRAVGAERASLESALARLEEARVSTMHTFCADLLRERPVEAGVDPSFQADSESSSEALFEEAFASWFESALAAPGPGLRRALARSTRGSKADDLLRAARNLARFRHLAAPWTDKPWDRPKALSEVTIDIRAVAEMSAQANDFRHSLYLDLRPFREAEGALARARSDDERESVVAFLAKQRDAMKPRSGRSFYAKTVERDALLARQRVAAQALEVFARAADATLATDLRGELGQCIAAYEALKQRNGVLDFDDLLLRTRALLIESKEARHVLQARLSHLFVDEFQDTDPVQAAILLLLSSADPDDARPFEAPLTPGKLFIVGDPKQSIYRFRNADLGTYELVKERIVETGGVILHLSESFRSVPGIQRFVNAAFSERMSGDRPSLQALYAPLEPSRVASSNTSVIALPVPAPYSASANLTKGAIEASLPKAIAAFVAWLCEESGLSVESPMTGELCPIEARHVCLLFRQLESFGSSLAAPYIEELSSRGIRHVLVGGRSFYDRDEIEAIHSVLEAIEWPDDSLHVVATLRGLFFGLSDEAIFEYKHRYKHLDPLRPPITALPEKAAEVGDALALLASLHRQRNARPVAETIADLLSRTRGHVALALMPNGEQALANVMSLGHVARAHEARGALSFRSFVESMRDMAHRRDTGEAPILEEESDGVRMMTAHRAKGLEFPVVILADLTSKPTQGVDKHIDGKEGLAAVRVFGCAPWDLIDNLELEQSREEAEGVRLAYVAATRARDMLVIPMVGDAPLFPETSWLAPLLAALIPTSPQKPRVAPGFPAFGDDSVVDRPHERAQSSNTVAPGLHETEGGDVVFFDPHVLSLDQPPVRRVRGADVIGPNASLAEMKVGADRLRDFREQRKLSRRAASRASVRALTVTAASHRNDSGPPPPVVVSEKIEVVVVPRSGKRSEGPRFGSLVHLTLATIELTANEEVVKRVAHATARLLGAPTEEAEGAAHAAWNAMQHPLLQRAQAAEERGECRREVPVTLCEDGDLIEGVVDLAFREDGVWWVVDFKTDALRENTRSIDAYRAQVALYAKSVTIATGEEARPLLFFV